MSNWSADDGHSNKLGDAMSLSAARAAAQRAADRDGLRAIVYQTNSPAQDSPDWEPDEYIEPATYSAEAGAAGQTSGIWPEVWKFLKTFADSPCIYDDHGESCGARTAPETPRALVWGSESDSENDDGSRAIARITRQEPGQD